MKLVKCHILFRLIGTGPMLLLLVSGCVVQPDQQRVFPALETLPQDFATFFLDLARQSLAAFLF